MYNRTKLSYVKDMAMEGNSAFIAMTETHLSENVENAEVNIPGYMIYRADRASPRSHGGCMVYVRNDLATQLVTSHSNGFCETLIVKIKTT